MVVSALTLSVAAVITAAPAYAVDPVAGGQTASPPDSLFPNQGNSGYDVSHYDINFAADFTPSTTNGAVGTSTINATTTVTRDHHRRPAVVVLLRLPGLDRQPGGGHAQRRLGHRQRRPGDLQPHRDQQHHQRH